MIVFANTFFDNIIKYIGIISFCQQMIKMTLVEGEITRTAPKILPKKVSHC